jgi:hypothetical protein
MQTRTIKVNYSRPRGYEIGYQGENNIVNLALPVPEHIEEADGYRVYFESSAGEYLQTELLTPVDGYVTVTLMSDIIPAPGQIAAQLVAFADGDIIGKAPVIYGTALYAIPSGTEQVSKSIEAEIALNSAARHTHVNKDVLDRLSDKDGKLQFDGKEISGGGGAATAADVNYELPEEVQTEFPWAEIEENTVKAGLDTAIYYALAGMYAKYIGVTLQGAAGTVDVSLQNFINNTYIPVANKAHEHDNKSILDEITAEKVNIWDNKQAKPSQVTSGTTITLADNTEYRLTDVTTLTLTYPTGSFECWMRLNFAASGDITVTLPAGTGYIGTAPDFKNGETWELSFKDKILAAQKVGEGT